LWSTDLRHVSSAECYSAQREYSAKSADEFDERFPFLKTLDAKEFDRILRNVYGLSNQRIWLLADEYSKHYLRAAGEEALLRNVISESLKAEVLALDEFLDLEGNKIVFSGFTESASSLLQSVSGRPVVRIPLPLIDANQRHRFTVMRSTLLDSFSAVKEPFPEMMYEVLKSCVGMMGYWIELCATGSYPSKLMLMEVPWVDKLLERKALYLQIAERYLQKWAVGSLDMGSFLKEEAHNFDSFDVGASIMVLPLSNRTVPHPVPFYALTYEFAHYFPDYAHKFTPLVTQLETVYDRIWAFLADVEVERAWKQTDHEFNVKVRRAHGSLVKEITYMIVQMHYYALASLTQPRPLGSCLTNWVLWEGRDLKSDPPELIRIPKDVAIMPNPNIKCLSLTGVRRYSLEKLFDATSDGDPEAEAQGKQVATVLEKKSTRVQRTKEEVEREREEQVAAFYSEVSKYGVLMARKKNSGFDLIASFPATKSGIEGMVLLIVETNCISDVALAMNTASKYDGKVFVDGSPLRMAAADRDEELQDSQPTPQSAERAADDELSAAQQDCLHFCATQKAWLSLRGVNQTLSHFKKMGKPVLDVCYVYVTLATSNRSLKRRRATQ
jgi:hypothetical protein